MSRVQQGGFGHQARHGESPGMIQLGVCSSQAVSEAAAGKPLVAALLKGQDVGKSISIRAHHASLFASVRFEYFSEMIGHDMKPLWNHPDKLWKSRHISIINSCLSLSLYNFSERSENHYHHGMDFSQRGPCARSLCWALWPYSGRQGDTPVTMVFSVPRVGAGWRSGAGW